jgi:histidine triad (HIT) family protein
MDCTFCQIASGNSPARILYHDELVTAFPDHLPAAPVHILIIPNRHIVSVNELTSTDAQLISHMVMVARELAGREGIRASGYRLIINTGVEGGQTIFHLHMHLIGGRHITRAEILNSKL